MIRVLIVDDSAVMRKVLPEELTKFPDITVVGTAADPYIAEDKISKLHPDVIILDLNMPRMDGLSFLGKIMTHNPLPVVIFSAFTPKNSEEAIRALELGAIEVISKPESSSAAPDIFRKLAHALRIAAFSQIKPNKNRLLPSCSPEKKERDGFFSSQDKIIAIGASTGGTKAIETVLMGLSPNVPGILIVQHMPENFTSAYAERLNKICPLEVREARNNDRVRTGLALLAPGNQHMLLTRAAGEYVVKLKDGPAVHYQKPSVDVLFQSVARWAGKNAIGVLLTGMGADGAKGMLSLYQAGAYTIAQDEESCVVFGMPKVAIKLGAVHEVVALANISQAIIAALTNQKKTTTIKPKRGDK